MSPAPKLLVALALIAAANESRAQIIRDSAGAQPKAAPEPVRPETPRPLTPIDIAQGAQHSFEAFRRTHLPHTTSRRPENCDERVGRFCYWYDSLAVPPREEPSVTAERNRLIATLDSEARLIPANYWVTEQRVRYLAEAERLDEALKVARGCVGDGPGNGWRCEILVGFVQHLQGDYDAAERTYDSAIAHMGPVESCEFRDIAMLLDNTALGTYRNLKCGDPAKDAFNARAWTLARTLYSVKANDSRTEWFARHTMVRMMKDAPGAHQNGFDEDEREMTLRFGWPRYWAAEYVLPFSLATAAPPPGSGPGGIYGEPGGPGSVGMAKGKGKGGTGVGSYPPGTKIPASVPPLVRPPDVTGPKGLPGVMGGAPDARPTLPQLPGVTAVPRDGDGISVVGMEPMPSYRYIPAGFVLFDPPLSDSAAWRPQLPPVMGRYAPAFAKSLVELEHQKAVFKRGDSAIVVMAYETKNTRAVSGAPMRVALAVTPAAEVIKDFLAIRDSAPPSGVLTVKAPWGPLLMSAEATAPSRNAVARARYGVGPQRGPAARVILSDLLFYKKYGAFPTSVEEVAPHAIPTERVNAKEPLGVYWEAYGTNPDGERMKIALTVMREIKDGDEPGFFRRMGRAIGGRDATPVSVSVDEVTPRGTTTTSRAIELDVSTLTKGAYIVTLEVTLAGQPAMHAEHRIEVVAP